MTATKFYLTKEGLKKVQEDHGKLLEFRRAKTMGEVPSILHSEEANPEYLAFQEDMSVLEARIAEYENILNNVALIKIPGKDKRDVVALGAVVTLEMDGTMDEFMIVGTMEADPAQKKISNESPIGKAILGSKVGSTVTPNTAVVSHTCKILKIRY
jgi:transcription elongation factor GreA